MAAHLHDSVLQTLALIQKQAGKPEAVAEIVGADGTEAVGRAAVARGTVARGPVEPTGALGEVCRPAATR